MIKIRYNNFLEFTGKIIFIDSYKNSLYLTLFLVVSFILLVQQYFPIIELTRVTEIISYCIITIGGMILSVLFYGHSTKLLSDDILIFHRKNRIVPVDYYFIEFAETYFSFGLNNGIKSINYYKIFNNFTIKKDFLFLNSYSSRVKIDLKDFSDSQKIEIMKIMTKNIK